MWFIAVLKFLWQLPQNLLGFLVITFGDGMDVGGYWMTRYGNTVWGVSLGVFIIFNNRQIAANHWLLKHEQGHQKQSLYLGPLYLIVIGLPSLIGNIIHRITGGDWYYKQPWESWANQLGGVEV